MKPILQKNLRARKFLLWAQTLSVCGLTVVAARAQTIQWGLTLTNIYNPTPTTVVTNGDGSISITTGGGDTYGAPDSFAYAYQQVTGDFDIRVRVVNVTCTNPGEQGSPKASLMVRASLNPDSYDFMINALPLSTSRNGQIESIGRLNLATDTDDLPGRNLNYGGFSDTSTTRYGGDTTDFSYCTYPDVWLRIQRQGSKLMSYFSTDATEDIPQGSNPGSTNGWQLLCVAPTTTNFPATVYIGLSTVAHNNDTNDSTDTVTSTYASYGPTPFPASIPAVNGVAVDPSMAPGAFPNNRVLAVNWDVSLPTNGLGYPGDTLQSSQGAASEIIWNDGGYTSVSRDILADINSESPQGFAAARYQCSGFDFTLSPHDPVLAQQNLGPYTNPNRDRYATGDQTVPACESYAHSPNYGFVMSSVHKNGASWNDQSPAFYAATYVQLDPIASSDSFDMLGGHLRGGQSYTRTTKLVTGSVSTGGPGSGSLQRCAIATGLAYFPYDQGWKAGYFADSQFSIGLVDQNNSSMVLGAGVPMWKDGDGWGLFSGAALEGYTNGNAAINYTSASQILTWVDTTGSGTYNGLATVKLPGVNSLTDGMLMTVGNDENNSIRGPSANNAALPDGSGWYVAVRDIDTSKTDPTIYATDGSSDCGSSFSFIYIPWNADNLIAGHIRGTNAATITGAGSYSVTRLSTGRYALTIPGKTDTNGTLLLLNSGYLATQPDGLTNVVDNSFLSYEYGGTNTPANAFIIESRFIDASGGGEGVATLRDADFNFVWVDFANPLAPPGTVSPVLSIKTVGGNAIISWTNGPGFILQSTTVLSGHPMWTNVGTQNPATVAITGGAKFFRVVHP
jgi:hypothetical protein